MKNPGKPEYGVTPTPNHIPRGQGNYRNVQQMPPNIQQMTSNIQQMPSNIQQMPSYFQQMPPNIQQMPPNIQQMPSNVQQMSPNFQMPMDFQQTPMNAQIPLPPQGIQMPMHQQSNFYGALTEIQDPVVQSVGVDLTLPCSLNTFGYGSDHDPNLLKGIADAGNGVYYFIKSNKDVPEAFADCLGGLLSVVAQNITLKIEAEVPAKIKNVFTKYPTKEIIASKCYEISLGDIQSEEQRDIVIMMELPSVSQEVEAHIFANATLTYFNVLNSSLETKTTKAQVQRPISEPPGQKVNIELDKQYNRLAAAEAMKQATDFGNAHNLEQARKVIAVTISRIQESVSASDEFCRGLVTDLQACSNGLRDQRSYASEGNQMLTNNFNAHSKQRSTNVQMVSQQVYQTSARNDLQFKQQQQFNH